MLKCCLDKWDANKGILEERLKNDKTLNQCDYKHLVELVVECILNSGERREFSEWDSKCITVVDNGDYQGTLLFLIPRNTYQPAEYEYLMTYVGYGSCCGCDTLLSIKDEYEEKVTNAQIKDFMNLCKDLVTNMIKPYNGGWREEEDFYVIAEKE